MAFVKGQLDFHKERSQLVPYSTTLEFAVHARRLDKIVSQTVVNVLMSVTAVGSVKRLTNNILKIVEHSLVLESYIEVGIYVRNTYHPSGI